MSDPQTIAAKKRIIATLPADEIDSYDQAAKDRGYHPEELAALLQRRKELARK